MTEELIKHKSQAFQGNRKYLTVYGLEGFQSKRSSIQLSKNLVIKKADEQFQLQFWERAKTMGTRKWISYLQQNQFFLYHKFEATPRAFGEKEHAFCERMRQMLRCFQEGGVDIQFFQSFFGHDKLDVKSAGFSSNASNYWLGHNKYNVDDKNVKFLQRFAKAFIDYDLEKARSVDVALRRLDYSYDRRDTEDQIIDLMIGFEALFSDSSGEITYKLSLRTSTFLAEYYDPEFVFDFMKKAYSLRSSIVHGGTSKKSIKVEGHIAENREVVLLLQTLLRIALKKIIVNQKTLIADELIETIDLAILPFKKPSNSSH